MFAPISRQEAELIQQQAPPSYGQLIAQGIIPPVEDFPTENPNEVRKKPLKKHAIGTLKTSTLFTGGCYLVKCVNQRSVKISLYSDSLDIFLQGHFTGEYNDY